MTGPIVDPENEEIAILSDGSIGGALRIIDASKIKNPSAPTVAELNAASGPIVGYYRPDGFTETT